MSPHLSHPAVATPGLRHVRCLIETVFLLKGASPDGLLHQPDCITGLHHQPDYITGRIASPACFTSLITSPA